MAYLITFLDLALVVLSLVSSVYLPRFIFLTFMTLFNLFIFLFALTCFVIR